MKKLLPLLVQRRDLIQSLVVLLLLFVVAVAMSPGLRKPLVDDLGFMSVTWPAGWPTFLTAGNLTDMLRANAMVGIMALGMTLVILTAGIDLSVGSILLLASVVTALILERAGLSMPVAILGGVAAGGAVGALNGALIAGLRVQPFIITLATMIGIRGLAKKLSNNESINLITEAGTPSATFVSTFSSKPVMIGTFIVLAAVFALLLWGTVFGRYVRSLGDNPKASDYAGLPTRRVLIAVYTLIGLLAGIAGVLMCARSSGSTNDQGIAAELDVIAVVVIGGTSLAGGRGSVLGTVIGLLIISILKNILGVNGVDQNEQDMIMAGVIIIAVAAQSLNGPALPSWLRLKPRSSLSK